MLRDSVRREGKLYENILKYKGFKFTFVPYDDEYKFYLPFLINDSEKWLDQDNELFI